MAQSIRSKNIKPAAIRLAVAGSLGAAAALITGLLTSWAFAPLAFWDTTAAVFLLWVWLSIGRSDESETARLATAEDPGRAATDVLMLSASVVSLAAVGFILIKAGSADGAAKGLYAGIGIISVVLSWLVVHTVQTLRYAREYYSSGGGVDFNQTGDPRFTDFAYLSFTIGMTFQVSDTELTNQNLRKIALRHALLSYLFGAVIVAVTVNLIAGFGK